MAGPPARIWWDANRRHQTTDFLGAFDEFYRHRSFGINYDVVSPLAPRNLSTTWISAVNEERTRKNRMKEIGMLDIRGAEETVKEAKASEPRWKRRSFTTGD